MSKKESNEVSDAILEAVEYQRLPDSNAAAASTLSAGDVNHIRQRIQDARDRAEAELKTLSQEAANDVDGWIAQAKKLQTDIQSSRNTAREIVKQAEEASLLREEYNDAARKVQLLQLEVSFTDSLRQTLREFQEITRTLDAAQNATVNGRYAFALEKLSGTEQWISRSSGRENTNAIVVIQQRTNKIKQNLIENVEKLWHKSFVFSESRSQFSICPFETDSSTTEDLLKVLTRLNLLESKISWLASNLSACIFGPLLAGRAGFDIGEIITSECTIKIAGSKTVPDASSMLDEVLKAIHFLNDNLPANVSILLSKILTPSISSRMLTHWLPHYIPTDVSGASKFEALLQNVASFTNELAVISWNGGADLIEWIEQGPKLWLSKRREVSLLLVRKSLSENISRTKTVERVETQVISRSEEIATIANSSTKNDNDDWDSGWQDEAQESGVEDDKDHEVDSSAWGFDDDGATEDNGPGLSKNDIDNSIEANREDDKQDEDAAWGWEEESSQLSPANHDMTAKDQSKLNGDENALGVEKRELTLRELYTVTTVPDDLHMMIKQVIQDAKTLRLPSYENTLMGAAGTALLSLPTLMLAGYRALASSYYTPLVGGNMYLYNDCLRLVLDLTSTAQDQAEEDASSDLSSSSWPSTRMKLANDITALESFGKRAYGREMESQRTILRDLLDGTQGFADCSEAPFASECQNAITTTVERVLEVEGQWRNILSRSALLQSLGSLVSTVVSKIIVDIEDLSDISEAESRQLRKYCDTVSRLSDLFRAENKADSSQASDMIGIYVPNWFKFQYLSEIMDSSLADIRHFWTEGGLKLEFEADEVVDLIQALFAESDHRRKAIAEIRRN